MSGIADSAVSFSQPLTERHFSLDELGKLSNLSDDMVRRLFEREATGEFGLLTAVSVTAVHL